MLDFFLIADEEPTPDEPGELKQVGGLELDEFDRLKRFGFFVTSRASYFDDWRLSSTELDTELENTRRRRTELTEISGFRSREIDNWESILSRAGNNSRGIVAFCD